MYIYLQVLIINQLVLIIEKLPTYFFVYSMLTKNMLLFFRSFLFLL